MSKMGALTSAQQMMEEELQQSVRQSEENAGYDSDADAPGEEDMDAEGEPCDEEAEADEDAEGDVDVDVQGEHLEEEDNDDEDIDDDDDDEDEGDQDAESTGASEDGSDEDAEAEEDDNYDDIEGETDSAKTAHTRADVENIPEESAGEDGEEEGEEDEEDEEDEEEGVGAVKLRPGQTDEEEESDASAAESSHDAESDVHSEEEAEWDGGVDDEEEEDGDESEAESDVEPPNTCMFCKQVEDNDPSEGDLEPFLTCTECDQSAHQHCAQENKVSKGKSNYKSWICPECADASEDEGVEEEEEEEHDDAVDTNGIIDADSPPATRRATAPKLARDLLPSQRGAVKPDSHSVFNQLVLDEDPMDGSRVLRKRKTSSIEGEELITHLRKRHRNIGDSHSIDDDNNPTTADGDEEDSRPRSARSLRLKISTNAPATIVKKTRSSLVVRLRVAPTELKKILSKKPKPRKRGGRRAAAATGVRAARAVSSRGGRRAVTPPLAPFASNISQPFYSFFDKDMDDKGKPYGGILAEAEADTSKTLPTNEDRRRFDEAKQKAEEDWKSRLLQMQAEIEVPLRKPKKSAGPASQIECIEFGGWEIDTWYAAPYPEEYSRNRVLFICEFCLKYMNSDYVAWRHKLKCPAKHPPGDEIYRSGSISVFEVDGRKNPVYCQNLCLLAKLFLGSKTLYYDVEPFLFYVLCEFDDLGYHFVGYFSKEKRASSQNNVSCILTLPIHQRKGYGNLLIDFSYLLTRVEGKCGSPEKPLSDMGLVSYRNYWRLVMCRYLMSRTSENRHEKRGLSVKQISDDTGMTADDVVSALEGLRALVRDPQTQLYAFRVDLDFCREYIAKWESKGYVQLDPRALTWTPYVMGRSNATNFELAPAMHAIAPREEDEEQKMVEAVIAKAIENGEHVQIPVGISEVVEQDAQHTEADVTVLESTEPNETGNDTAGAEAHPMDEAEAIEADVETEAKAEAEADAEAEVGLEAAQGRQAIEEEEQTADIGGSAECKASQERAKADGQAEEDKENSWVDAYKDIPPTRFTVFPPAHGGRRIANRAPATPRPPVSRATSMSRPKGRSASRRSTAPKSRNSSSRNRKPGGTGRGPGRWPKGTKKSDYGNADSGPGLPPAWVERQRLATKAAEARRASAQPVENGVIETLVAQEDGGDTLVKDRSPRKANGTSSRSSAKSSRSGGDADGDVIMHDGEAAAS